MRGRPPIRMFGADSYIEIRLVLIWMNVLWVTLTSGRPRHTCQGRDVVCVGGWCHQCHPIQPCF